ncbi:MAG: hypothetical protein LM583_01090 [Desulfurococcaceae archaeon]|nr:hypothetical protein [Desulfurococcaceae archaeon]
MGEEYLRELCKQSFGVELTDICVNTLQMLKQLLKTATLQRMEKCYKDPEYCAKTIRSVNKLIHKIVFIVVPAVVDVVLEELVEDK